MHDRLQKVCHAVKFLKTYAFRRPVNYQTIFRLILSIPIGSGSITSFVILMNSVVGLPNFLLFIF